ncbi:MAG: hypothetical protein ABIH23_09095, partial [bacterium]
LAFGLPALFMLSYWQAWTRIRQGESDVLFLFCWVATVFCLIYGTPFLPFSKRLAEGVQIAVVILGVRCLYDQWIPWAKSRFSPSRKQIVLLSFLSVVLLIPTTLFLVCNTTIAATSRRAPYSLTSVELEALDQLDERADKSKGILVDENAGNFIPRHTGMHVYCGHRHISPDRTKRVYLVRSFLSGKMTERRMRQFLEENRIGYVWIERRKDKHVHPFPADCKFLRIWYERDSISIYEVVL